MVTSYFLSLFHEESVERRECLKLYFLSISNFNPLSFTEAPSTTEVKSILFNMGSFKALGLDSFQVGFYQHNWEIVHKTLVH